MVTSLAGFAGTGVGADVRAGFAAAESVITSMAGFAGQLPSPAAGRPQGDSSGLQIGRRRFAANTGGPLNAPQRPSQPPQRYDLLFLFLVQDVAHIDGGYRPRVESTS